MNKRKYYVEYEGLHFLCKGCGRFGHYIEGCLWKVNEAPSEPVRVDGPSLSKRQGMDSVPDSEILQWVVVQKARRQKKGRVKVGIEAGGKDRGSRFEPLAGVTENDVQEQLVQKGHKGNQGSKAKSGRNDGVVMQKRTTGEVKVGEKNVQERVEVAGTQSGEDMCIMKEVHMVNALENSGGLHLDSLGPVVDPTLAIPQENIGGQRVNDIGLNSSPIIIDLDPGPRAKSGIGPSSSTLGKDDFGSSMEVDLYWASSHETEDIVDTSDTMVLESQ